ncbi:MAG: hypothetical protein M1831_005915 [Alyxoria varia]|nr:MAG: hypothetical protein M1831_005915 [Alyxoria varia]
MAKKKQPTAADESALPGRPSKSSEAPGNSLAISRNKHWRYISAFHGPWLQLPHELLSTLAHSNYFSLPPRQTDPGVLFDLLKVRKLVDEAADLAVRAQNGTASSALGSENGLPGAALGLNIRGGGGNAKLSPERKYRMRELATQKLSQAYRLDEIAASVATMQSASALDNVGQLVLQRAPNNPDAKYVHFFHEKIPSRMMAECTSLDPLNEVIALGPGHAAPYRTRALTRIFKEDFSGAAEDLTEALSLCKMEEVNLSAGKNQLISWNKAREDVETRKPLSREWISDHRVNEEDQPRGLEMQLLFQRGNQFLTIAVQNVRKTLRHLEESRRAETATKPLESNHGQHIPSEPASYQRALDSREFVRKYAKKALRDYTSFFARLDYAYAPLDIQNRHGVHHKGSMESSDTLDGKATPTIPEESNLSQALITRRPTPSRASSAQDRTESFSETESFSRFEISQLLSSTPPQGLPQFPTHVGFDTYQHEMITYHPLMLETLHSLLLAHCLLQTAPTTLSRIANNAARVARLADGYPFFLSARSPARADWIEILRKSQNWIGLSMSWESLCKSTPGPGSPTHSHAGRRSKRLALSDADKSNNNNSGSSQLTETYEERKDRIHKEAVIEALGDERVVDDVSFQKAVEARKKRAWEDSETAHEQETSLNDMTRASERLKLARSNGASEADVNANGHAANGAKSTAHIPEQTTTFEIAKDDEYMIGTERADTIAHWVLEAPNAATGATLKPKKGKKKSKKGVTHEQSGSNFLDESAAAGA